MLILTELIAAVILVAVWTLVLKIVDSLLLSGTLDLTDYAVFHHCRNDPHRGHRARIQKVAVVVAERRESIAQVRTVILLALLAIVRKLIVLDLSYATHRSCSPSPLQCLRSVESIGLSAIRIVASGLKRLSRPR